MINYKKSLQNQKYLPIDHDDFEGQGVFNVGIILALGIVIGCGLTLLIKGCVREPMPAIIKNHGVSLQCHSCHNKLASYFKKKGSKNPEEMAYAVLQTKSPRLLASIAVVETRGNHTTRRTGYKNQHDGAFQVNKRYWGKVPYDATSQAKQAESILTELTQEMPIKKALALYGGDSTDAYGKRVLTELQNVPK
jgi:hypothetical protein